MVRAMAAAKRGGWWSWGAFAFGFAYWFAFVLVLEPGNIQKAAAPLPWMREIVRMTGAGLLGAAITPFVFALTARRPVEGPADWRRILWYAGWTLGLAALLIVVSTILAVAFLDEGRYGLAAALAGQFEGNFPLLVFFVGLLIAIAHGAYFHRRLAEASEPPVQSDGWLKTVTVKDRGTLQVVALADVGWIESQGNYVALHAAGQTHLIRETLAGFEARLDPRRFARIHRRTIVALARIKTIKPVAGGDALVTLDDGADVRMSRSYRDAVGQRIAAR
jgi:uncharacterized membrane protein